jgi:hypothetical protein
VDAASSGRGAGARRASVALLIACVLGCALGCTLGGASCGSKPAPGPSTGEAVTARAALRAPTAGPGAPPAVAFEAPRPWQSTRPGSTPLAPPDPTRETWRALASQNEPLQKKTPHWQPLPAERTLELAMPEGSAHRCVVGPLQVTVEADDFGAVLEAWVLARTLSCSSDGFAHWTEHRHVVRVAPDGRREVTVEGGALLRERDAADNVRQSFVMLRADEERRVATTGPPRILPGVEVD